jgi:hypothetical protein
MLQRRGVASLALVLYLATLSTDAIRKVAGLPTSLLGVVYVITALIYVIVLPGIPRRKRETPHMLPACLFLLSLWCLAVALVQHIPIETALLGWLSYVFFVPLLYVGAELAADDRLAAKALKVVVISGGIVGAGSIASALLGNSAPRLLQPIIPSVGLHSFTTGSIYLAPSLFATAEEASEQLLIALFAWAALTHMTSGRLRPIPSAFLGLLVASGLIVSARRADIDVAIAGIIAVLIQGGGRVPASVRKLSAQTAAKTRGRLGATSQQPLDGELPTAFRRECLPGPLRGVPAHPRQPGRILERSTVRSTAACLPIPASRAGSLSRSCRVLVSASADSSVGATPVTPSM